MHFDRMLLISGAAASVLLLGGCASNNRNAVVFQGGTYKLSGPSGIAIDGAGNVWVTNTKNDTVTELKGVAVPVGGWQNSSPGQEPAPSPGRKEGKEKVFPLTPQSSKTPSTTTNAAP